MKTRKHLTTILTPFKIKTMTKTNFLISLLAALLFVAVYALPILVCEFIHYGVQFLSSF